MSAVAALSVREVLALLLLFRMDRDVRERGDHTRYRHRDGRVVTLVEHEGRPISPTLVRLMAADLGMSVEDFLHEL